ncbi:hypothetical protein GCK72_015966 [Caenorhabditis remanei]|uniref:Uncharacterized protein n=1 Tax=Caenorhabditis remanei TaxID=31234 RepID=A0A6A5GXW7_CAERE|nr:hypothetical protein GCK72_015966 [Caenorhabditis remanei]KAF1759499.1 hypothetical protein GCK72_015966 [Caenorhabditis remanei]
MSSDDEEVFPDYNGVTIVTLKEYSEKEQTETTEVRRDLVELENKHGDAATVLFSQIIDKLGSLWNTAISLHMEYENTEHRKLFQEVFQRASSVKIKLVLHHSLETGSSTTIQEALQEIYELRMMLNKQSTTSSLSGDREATTFPVCSKSYSRSLACCEERSHRGPIESSSIVRSSYRRPIEIFGDFEPQVARINLNQDLEDQVTNLKNEVNNLFVDCTAAEDTMKSCLTTIAQNSRKLDELENKVSSLNDKQKTATQEAIVSELSHQIRTAKLKQNELKNQLASPGFDHREVSGRSTRSRRQELLVYQPITHSLSVLQAVLEIHCDNVIAICKREYSFAKRRDRNQNEGELGASILHHFLRIEANVLKFQRISALRRIGKEVSEKRKHKTRSLSDRVVKFHRGGLLTDLNKMCTELKTLRDELNNKLSLRRMSFLYFSFENHNQELLLSGSTFISDIEELLGIPDFVLDVLMELEANPRTVSNASYHARINNFLEALNY